MINKNITIAAVVVVVLTIGISIGIGINPDNNADKQKPSKQDETPTVDTNTYTMQRDLSQYEKHAMEYLLEATFSTDVNVKKLNELGGCEDDRCQLVNNLYDNGNITGEFPSFISKSGTYYVGSDIANQAPDGQGQVLVYILVPPKSMESMESKEPSGASLPIYPKSNLVVFNLSKNDDGKTELESYDAYSAADYKKYYEYNDFISSEIGQLITKEANLDWRPVNVQSKTKFQ
ncbi:hypothetical protein MK805_12885 [Shimazuella sp. AN120528]|uniref:hypothetical protein n=1 Tax=Shimazuella soli TaxID=1892854 RepID=UPI001F0E1ABD|nr:hypothetical protein [Shimazuella soli]MCH5585837.1 hypothetical protein [Shimazuella soli]